MICSDAADAAASLGLFAQTVFGRRLVLTSKHPPRRWLRASGNYESVRVGRSKSIQANNQAVLGPGVSSTGGHIQNAAL